MKIPIGRELPQKVESYFKDLLYLYIRGGDIFLESCTHNIRGYFQPPLCFYEKILDNFKFNKVFILSQDSLNPVIPKIT